MNEQQICGLIKELDIPDSVKVTVTTRIGGYIEIFFIANSLGDVQLDKMLHFNTDEEFNKRIMIIEIQRVIVDILMKSTRMCTQLGYVSHTLSAWIDENKQTPQIIKKHL